MKLSFELARSNAVASRVPKGDAIRSALVQPGHASLIREYTESNRRMLRMYDAAITSNLNPDFRLTVGSANAEILTSLYLARGRSRTLCKDYPTAKGIIRTFKNNVVGDDPFRLDMKVGTWSADRTKFTPDTRINSLIEEAWDEAGLPENCTVRKDMSRMELYQLAIACAIRDGGVLFRHRRDFPGNKYHYALQVIEQDRLQESWMGRGENQNVIRFSIERDEYDAPVAYWILSRNPGDLFQYNGQTPNTWRERVKAEDIIYFGNLRDRAEQDIGFPELDSIIQQLHRDRQFDIAHVTAAIWSCAKPVYITRNKPTANNYEGDAQTRKGEKISSVEPATAEILPDGYGVESVDPKFPIEAATAFKRDNMLAVASGSGLSYGSVSSDFEKYSFSTARAAQVPERDNFKVYQEHEACNFVRLHFNGWLKNAILTGQLDLPMARYDEFCRAANFEGKNFPYIQPVQDAAADIQLLEAKLKSRTQIGKESASGKMPNQTFSELEEEQKYADAHGIQLQEPQAKGDPNKLTEVDDETEEPTKPETLKRNGFSMNGKGWH